MQGIGPHHWGPFLQACPFFFQLVANETVEALHKVNAHGSFCLNDLGHRLHDEACGDLLQILWRELVDLVKVDGDLAQEGFYDFVFRQIGVVHSWSLVWFEWGVRGAYVGFRPASSPKGLQAFWYMVRA